MGDPAAEAVAAYLAVRPEPADAKSEDILFLNKSGKQLSRISVFNMVKKQAMLAGITTITGEWAYVRTTARGRCFAVLRPESDDSVTTIRYV